jgi:hypothetical protein
MKHRVPAMAMKDAAISIGMYIDEEGIFNLKRRKVQEYIEIIDPLARPPH